MSKQGFKEKFKKKISPIKIAFGVYNNYKAFLVFFIVLATTALFIVAHIYLYNDSLEKNEKLIILMIAVLGTVFSLLGWTNTFILQKSLHIPIFSFQALMMTINDEIKYIINSRLEEWKGKNIFIIVRSPALGNISSPYHFEEFKKLIFGGDDFKNTPLTDIVKINWLFLKNEKMSRFHDEYYGAGNNKVDNIDVQKEQRQQEVDSIINLIKKHIEAENQLPDKAKIADKVTEVNWNQLPPMNLFVTQHIIIMFSFKPESSTGNATLNGMVIKDPKLIDYFYERTAAWYNDFDHPDD